MSIPEERYVDITRPGETSGGANSGEVRDLKRRLDQHIGAGGQAHAVATETAAGFMSQSDKVKLDGVQNNATENMPDDYLLARGNQTGVQAIETVNGLREELNELGGSRLEQLTEQAEDAADRAETAAETASAAGLIYEASGDGQADSELAAGDYFWVVSGSDAYVLELWRKGASSAVDTGKRSSSKNYLESYADTFNVDDMEVLGEEILTLKNQVVNGTPSETYDSTGPIPVFEGQVVEVKGRAYGTVAIIGLTLRNRTIPIGISQSANGLYSKLFVVPKGMCWLKATSVNPAHPNYTSPSEFSVTIKTLKANNVDNVLSVSYPRFVEKSLANANDWTYSNYRYMLMPVAHGQVIDYKNAIISGDAPNGRSLIIFDDNYNELFSTKDSTGQIAMPENAACVVVSSIDENHPQSTQEVRDGFYVKRGSVTDESYVNERLDAAEGSIAFLLGGGVFSYDASFFTEQGGSSNYVKTPHVQLGGATHAFVVGQNLSSARHAFTGIDESGNEVNLSPAGSTRVAGAFCFHMEIPNSVVSVALESLADSQSNYEEGLSPLLVIGISEDAVRKEAATLLAERYNFSGFPVTGSHPVYSNRPGTDSTNWVPLLKGTQVTYSVMEGAYGGVYHETTGGSDGSNERVYILEKSGTFVPLADGLMKLVTFNSGDPEYDPDFTPSYSVDYIVDGPSSKPVQIFIDGEYLSTPTLKAIREISFTDGTERKAMQYLWQDRDNNFFISSSKYGHKQFIFRFSSGNFYDKDPSAFSVGFDHFGNILFVYRTELESWSAYSDDVRKNPIVLLKNENYKIVEIDFGDSVKPSNWLQNGGFLCTEDAIYIAEYTRPSVETANAWKATYPLTNPANWERIQTFQLSPESQPSDNIKHMHSVERDPFTGYIYTTTGDNNAGAAIYVTTDGGSNFTTVLSGSEKYARVLNFVFTKDYIYWATDSSGANHWFFKAPRDTNGVLDANNITDIIQFPVVAQPTYASIHLEDKNLIVFLGRDGFVTETPIYAWDFETDQLVLLDAPKSINEQELQAGFRCECHEFAPRDGLIICGFSKLSRNTNHIGILGNTEYEGAKVNNLVLNINRVGSGFKVTYDTVSN